ncbi:MAG: signal peptidase I [Bacteroidetes bacterium]|nr:signal peptidase I [Bacteroidota bacterium]
MESFNLGLFLTLWCTAFILTRAALASLFKKAGIAWYLACIPVLSWWYWIKLVGRPWWYMIGMVIPCVNILFSFNITLDLLRSFGQNRFWQHFLGIVFTFFYLPLIAFRKDVVFLGPAGKAEWRKKNIPPHAGTREWADALLFAAYVAGGMRALYFDLYQIPTPSMESNLMVGDFLVVSRAKVGMRIPMTPITVPVVAHKDLFGFKAFSDIVELPYMRLPGWYTIKNNDVIVFNWPADNNDEFPVDKRDNYVKRCIGIPGDSVAIVEGIVYINGKKLPAVGRQQKQYVLGMKEPITTEFLSRYDLGVADPFRFRGSNGDDSVVALTYIINTYEENAAAIGNDPAVKRIVFNKLARQIGGHGPFLDSSVIGGRKIVSDLDNYGPFYLPKRGDKIQLTPGSFDFYGLAINNYEKADITMQGNKFFQNGEEVKSYTFKYGYYWMMGDNRFNSYDSRMWGYVPENHIVGKPLFTFLSMKKAQEVIDGNPQRTETDEYLYKFQGIRWNRIMRAIR